MRQRADAFRHVQFQSDETVSHENKTQSLSRRSWKIRILSYTRDRGARDTVANRLEID